MADPPKAKGLVDLVEETTKEAFAGLERSMTRGYADAGAALATPDGAELAPLLAATDLPELPVDGPLGNLGVRLDREADLHRNVALRELARVGWMERLGLIVALLACLGEAAVAACAAFSAMIGSEGRGSLFALSAIILAGAAGGIYAMVARNRIVHRELAEDALKRARQLEERIFRLGIVMEWRAAGPVLFQDALARLERDLAPAPPSLDPH